jgi:xanthine dehydrogenase YagR molybdenum-binding subunit
VVTVATDMTDIGTGSYTVIAQTAAEMMGVPIDKVVVLLGDSTFPVSAGSGGQWGGNSSTLRGLRRLRQAARSVARKAGLDPATAVFENGKVRAGGKSLSLAKIAGPAGLSAEEIMEFGDLGEKFAQRPSAPTSPRSGSMPTPARSACGG